MTKRERFDRLWADYFQQATIDRCGPDQVDAVYAAALNRFMTPPPDEGIDALQRTLAAHYTDEYLVRNAQAHLRDLLQGDVPLKQFIDCLKRHAESLERQAAKRPDNTGYLVRQGILSDECFDW
jgi:hypothetical protein